MNNKNVFNYFLKILETPLLGTVSLITLICTQLKENNFQKKTI